MLCSEIDIRDHMAVLERVGSEALVERVLILLGSWIMSTCLACMRCCISSLALKRIIQYDLVSSV